VFPDQRGRPSLRVAPTTIPSIAAAPAHRTIGIPDSNPTIAPMPNAG
jgi:hypothetical protein